MSWLAALSVCYTARSVEPPPGGRQGLFEGGNLEDMPVPWSSSSASVLLVSGKGRHVCLVFIFTITTLRARAIIIILNLARTMFSRAIIIKGGG